MLLVAVAPQPSFAAAPWTAQMSGFRFFVGTRQRQDSAESRLLRRPGSNYRVRPITSICCFPTTAAAPGHKRPPIVYCIVGHLHVQGAAWPTFRENNQVKAGMM